MKKKKIPFRDFCVSRNKLVKEQARVVFKSYIFSAVVGIVHCKSYGENIFFLSKLWLQNGRKNPVS